MSLEQNALWLRLESGQADPYARMAEELARNIGPPESDEIVEFLRTGTDQQKKTALTILLMVRGRLRDDPACFSEAQRHTAYIHSARVCTTAVSVARKSNHIILG